MKLITGEYKPLDMLVRQCETARTEFGPNSKQYAKAYRELVKRAKREAEVQAIRLTNIKRVA